MIREPLKIMFFIGAQLHYALVNQNNSFLELLFFNSNYEKNNTLNFISYFYKKK